MSASKDRKFRQQQIAAGLDKKSLAAAEEERKRKKTNITYAIVAVIVVIAIVLAFYVSSALPSKHMTAVDINGEKYTVAQTNFYYSYSYMNFYQNYYYYFMYGMGPFDTSTDLAEQECDESYADEENWHEGYTWHDYFVDSAIDTMTQVQMMCEKADEAGFTLDEEHQSEYEESLASVESAWEENGYSSLSQFLTLQYGEGVTQDVLETELARIYLASAYSEYVYDSYDITAEDEDAYYAEHADELDDISFAYYAAADEDTANMILAAISDDSASDETASDETASDETASDEASAEVEASDSVAAVDALNEYLASTAGDTTADDSTDDTASTAETATEISYSGEQLSTYYGDEMAAWLLDASRVAGDAAVLTANDTPYVVVFESRDNHDYNLVSFRHILVNAVDGDDDGTYTDEEIAAAHDTAEGYYEEWLNGAATEDSFAELANEYSEDTGSNTNGGLYEDVYKGQMVDGINDWLFEEGRAAGDTTVIDNAGSYTGTHVVYFVGAEDMTYAQSMAESDMRSEDLNNDIETWLADYTATTSHLGMVGDAH